MPEIAEQVVAGLKGVMSIAPTVNVSSSTAIWGQQPDASLTTRQGHDPFNVWYERTGGTVVQSETGYDVATDAAQSGSEAVLETSNLGIYRPGTLASATGGVYIRTRPTGDGFVDIGYTLDEVSDGMAHRVTADDLQGRFLHAANATEFTVSRNAGDMEPGAKTEKTDSNGDVIAEVYGVDPVDGSGPSNVEWVPGNGYIYGFLIGWYGPSTSVAFIKALGEYNREWAYRTWPLYVVNPVGDPLFQKPNRPFQVRVDNGTTAEAVEARVLGRQYQVFGDLSRQIRPIWSSSEDQTIPMDGTGSGDRDWFVVGVARRKTGEDATVVGLEDFEIASDAEPMAIHARTVDESHLSNTTYQSPVDIDPSNSPIELDMASDTPGRVTLADYTTSQGDVIPQGVAWKGDIIGAGGKNKAREGDLKGDLQFPIVRDHPTVWLARTRTGASDSVDTNIQLEVIG